MSQDSTTPTPFLYSASVRFFRSLPLLILLLLCLKTADAQEWQPLHVPGPWEGQTGAYDGFAWYRCFVDVPKGWVGSRLLLTVRAIGDVDEAYFNGHRVGANGGMPPLFGKPSSDIRRPAVIDPDLIRYGQPNLIAFRVYDASEEGGILEGPIQLGRLEDAIDLSGTWDFIQGDRREFGSWPNNDPTGTASQALIQAYFERHSDQVAGHRGLVPADIEGRERDMAMVRQRFEGNTNVHSNIEGKGSARPPADARAALTPGPNMRVETVLHEPTLTQPLYVEFDAKGRLWAVQYIQYPTPAGLKVLTWDNHLRSIFDVIPPPPPYQTPEEQKFVGRDRITIHEDTDGDGIFDHHHTFLDGLNIVTATCQGEGGVWVMNPPYLLFYADADGDDLPDGAPEVHLSGFGLEDTHSVANSLKWGPDGWLYGATGSTVTARVKVHAHPERPPLTFFGQNIWRYHPDSHRFELFAEGGWNTFGVDFDAKGRLFSGTNGSMQAVYFVQGAFYQKGFGKHGPHTNPHAFDYFHGIPIEGKHERLVQQWLPYTGGVYPGLEGALIGVNCLANRVPVIVLEPDGSSFRSREQAAAIESNDVWFRPVHVALGPDGLLYISDFYDARITHVDPRDNWDREHGRVYRLQSQTAKPHPTHDLTVLPTPKLLEYLDHPNQWQRWTARRLLKERQDPSALAPLRERLRGRGQGALEALWTLHVLGALDEPTALAALRHEDPHLNLWTVRLLGDRETPLSASILTEFTRLAQSEDPRIISQMASTLQRLPVTQALSLLAGILDADRFSSDPYIPSQLWWALEKQLTRDPEGTVAWLADSPLWTSAIGETKLAFLIGRRLAANPSAANLSQAARVLHSLQSNRAMALQVIRGMEAGLQGISLSSIPPQLGQVLAQVTASGKPEVDLITFAIRLKSPEARRTAQALARQSKRLSVAERQRLIDALSETPTPNLTTWLLEIAQQDPHPDIQRSALNGLRRAQGEGLPAALLELAEKAQDPTVSSTALAVLAGRAPWAEQLVDAVASRRIPRERIGLDHVLVMQRHPHPPLAQKIAELWGNLRQPSKAAQQHIDRTLRTVRAQSGNAAAGAATFAQACATCHRLFDRGSPIGPDLTGYDRSDLAFLVTAVIDPNLALREEYELTTITLRGSNGSDAADAPTVLSGFVTDLTEQQLTLKDLTGTPMVVATQDILQKENLPVSIMPEGLLNSLTEQQVADLFAYLQAAEDPIKTPDTKP